MSDREILQKAIVLAAANGLEYLLGLKHYPHDDYVVSDLGDGAFQLGMDGHVDFFKYRELIFDHDFAEALWGRSYQHTCDRHYNLKDCQDHLLPAYKWHLQQMVISPNPIKYLGENLPKERA